MATQQSRSAARLMMAPAVVLLLGWMLVPLIALVWKNMFMDPINGILAHLWKFFGAEPVLWLSQESLPSIIMIVSWQWLPFATLILLTAVQSLDREQLEAAVLMRIVGKNLDK